VAPSDRCNPAASPNKRVVARGIGVPNRLWIKCLRWVEMVDCFLTHVPFGLVEAALSLRGRTARGGVVCHLRPSQDLR
jgi:hypothetical protein